MEEEAWGFQTSDLRPPTREALSRRSVSVDAGEKRFTAEVAKGRGAGTMGLKR